MLDYKLIEAFAAVIQEGGFEKAASKLYITQSAVSQRIKLLEEQFGQIVLLRSVPPQPTAFGRKLLGLYNRVSRLESDLLEGLDIRETDWTSLPVGVNADTLATWFFRAVEPFLTEKKVVLDVMVDDQEETDKFLRDGKVLGCITTRRLPVQGCSVHYLGDVEYGLFCSQGFKSKWFPNGIDAESVKRAPMITFNRKDMLNVKILQRKLNAVPAGYSTHYVPSSELFMNFLEKGLAYGAIPHHQSDQPLREGKICELAQDCKETVPLFWQCWNLDSSLLQGITENIIQGFTENRCTSL